jgi:hypothetical protein
MAARTLSGNDISVWKVEQTVKGEIPANPEFNYFRRTEGAARKQVAYVQSSEVKTNRQARQNLKDTVTFPSELSFEMTKQTIGEMQAAFQSTESVRTATSATIAFDATGASSTDGSFAGFDAGDYIFVSGSTSNDRVFKITAKTDSDNVDLSPAPTTEAAGASITIDSNRTVTGKTPRYFAIQTRTVDQSAVGNVDYRTFYDCQINTGSFEIAESGIVTGAANYVGEQLNPGSASISGQTDAAIDQSAVISAQSGIEQFWVDGTPDDCIIKSMGFELTNNLQEDNAAACEGAEYANGDLGLTGSLVARNRIDDANVWRDRYENGTNLELAVTVDHGNDEKTVFVVESCKITEHTRANGSNAVANSEMTYSAEESSRGYTAAIYRNWV